MQNKDGNYKKHIMVVNKALYLHLKIMVIVYIEQVN